MKTIKPGDYTGYSKSGLNEAISNALQKAGDYQRIEVIETRSSHYSENTSDYQVTLTTIKE